MPQAELVGTAYSYLRFSSKRQERGHSVQRQIEARDNWLSRNPGVQFAPEKAYADLGTSGFRGRHRTDDKGALKQLLSHVESGKIKAGSFLIVESLDRLTREELGDAFELVLGLVNRGIRIVQLSPVESIIEKPVNMTMLMLAVVELSRGHGESERKSDLISAKWADKRRRVREGTAVFTSRCPSWLEPAGGKFAFKPGAKVLVRRIFSMSAAGYGCRAIAATFNSEQIPTWSAETVAWHDSLIRRIVRGREALGEFQPKLYDPKGKSRRKPEGDAVTGYYPAAVTEAEWHAAAVSRKSRHKKGGRPAKEGNLSSIFRGLMRDGLTGDKLVPLLRNGNTVLVTFGFRARGDAGRSFPLVPFERCILSRLAELEARDVLGGNSDKPDDVADFKAKLARIDNQLQALADEYDDDAEEIPVITAKVKAKHAERKQLAEDLEKAETRAASPLSSAWGEAKGLIDVYDMGRANPDVRIRLRSALARVIESVTAIFAGDLVTRVAAVRVQFVSGLHRNYTILHVHKHSSNKMVGHTEVFNLEATDKQNLDLRTPDGAAIADKILKKLVSDLAAEKERPLPEKKRKSATRK